jgi:hypothetical protein
MHKKVDKYNAFRLNEYNGIFEIVSGNEGEDGKFYTNWVIASKYDSDVGGGVPVKKDTGTYRNLPVKVVLGDRATTIDSLGWLLNQIEEYDAKNEPDDDVPF